MSIPLKHGSTIILRSALLAFAAAVLAFCIFALPIAIRELELYRPLFIVVYLSALPFFAALYKAWKLLDYIDRETAFSLQSVDALKIIARCGALISLLYTVILPFVYHAADIDDAPGAIVLTLVIVFAAAVVATFAAVLQKLLQRALVLQSEHDLTV